MQFLDLAGVKQFKQYVDEKFTPVEDHENAEKVAAAALNDLNDRVTDIEDGDWVTAEDYSEIEEAHLDVYTKSEIDTMFSEIDGSNGVTSVKIGSTTYNPSNGVVSLPAYPTVTDTKNTAGSTDTSSKIFLIGSTSQAANPQTYSDNEVYATSGVLTTKSVQVGGTAATMQYNSTDQSIEFIFA